MKYSKKFSALLSLCLFSRKRLLMKSFLSIVLTVPFMILLVACNQEKSTPSHQESLYIVQSNPKKTNSKIIEMDRDLNIKKEVDIDAKSIARSFKNMDTDGENIYITTEYMSPLSTTVAKKIVKYSTKSDSVKFLDIPTPLADTISCDKDSIYATHNWNGKVELYMLNKNGKKKSSFLFDEDRVSPYTKVIDKNIYAVSTGFANGSNHTALYAFDKKNLKIQYSFILNEEDEITPIKIFKKKNLLYIVGGYNEPVKEKSSIILFDESKKEYKTFKMDLDVVGAVMNGDDIYIFTSEGIDNRPLIGEVYKFDTKKNTLSKIKKLNRVFYIVEKIDDRYVLLNRDELYLLDKNFNEIKKVTLKDEYNLDMITV